MSLSVDLAALPGRVRRRGEVAAPDAYVVFDCETTGTVPARDEIVSFAAVRLDTAGREIARCARLVRPSQPIPAAATSVHGIDDAAVVTAPAFHEVALDLRQVLGGAVFVAHNAAFDLAIVQRAFAAAEITYRPPAVACTLAAFRLIEPLADGHALETVCARHGICVDGAHDALSDALATVELLRLLLAAGLAPESVELDEAALWRLRSRGDTRPASDAQIRRVFALARSAGILQADGKVDRRELIALVERVTTCRAVETLTREQVQVVYDALDQLIGTARHAA